MANDDFDPFKLIKKILGKQEEPKPVPAPVRIEPVPAVVVAPAPEPPKPPRVLLLEALEKLSDSQRIAQMVQVGRVMAGEGPEAVDALELVRQLTSGDFYERRLALYAAFGAKNTSAILEFRKDESATLRALSTRLATNYCSDEELVGVAAGLKGCVLRNFLSYLKSRQKHQVIDSCLAQIESADSEPLEHVFMFGSSDFVASTIERVSDLMDDDDFVRLAKYHSSIAADYLLTYASNLQPADVRFGWLFNRAAAKLAEREPEKTVQILRTASDTVALSTLNIDPILRRQPEQIVELLIEVESLNLFDKYEHARALRKISDGMIERLLSVVSVDAVRYWLRYLSPEQRRLVYDKSNLSWRQPDGQIDAHELGLLPADIRLSEARRILRLPAVVTSVERLSYAIFLPWQEALSLIDPYLQDSDAHIRGRALSQLVKAVRYERGQLSAVLSVLEQHRNEPDIVRVRFLAALEELPVIIFRPAHFSSLDKIIRDSLNATDISITSLSHILGLCFRLIHHHTEWSCKTIAAVLRERGRGLVYCRGLRSLEHLSDIEARELDRAMSEFLRAPVPEEREEQVVALARVLGKKIIACTETLKSLEHIIRHSSSDSRAELALQCLASSAPRQFAELVPGLLEQDKTWSQNQLVSDYLNRHAQELLTPFLGQYAYQGRFSNGKTRVIPNLEDNFDKWTTTQHKIFAAELEALALREQTDLSDVFYAIARLCRMPAPPIDRLSWLARRDNPQPAVRDYTIRQLSVLDNAKGVPLLQECLADERARVAIYSLRGALRWMEPEQAIAILKQVPHRQISIHKEVVRLVGEVGGPEALEWLLSLSQTELHRDVQGALLRALWHFCESSAEVWDVFEQAAQSSDAVVASAVYRIPGKRLSGESRRRLARALAHVIQSPDENIRLGALLRLRNEPVVDVDRVLLKPLIAKMSSKLPRERSAAAFIFFSRYAPEDEQSTELVVMTVLKNRHHLQSCLDELLGVQRAQPARMNLVTRATLRTLWCDPLTTVHQIRVAFGGLPSNDLARFLRSVEHANRLHYGAVAEAVRICGSSELRYSAEDMDKIERVMFNKKSDGLRRIGLALLQALGTSAGGWTAERIARLHSYRKDTSLLVATDAEFTFYGPAS